LYVPYRKIRSWHELILRRCTSDVLNVKGDTDGDLGSCDGMGGSQNEERPVRLVKPGALQP
jgi:hypothetical protein